MRGEDVDSLALPSLVMMVTVPVSATRKFPPEIPMSAWRYFFSEVLACDFGEFIRIFGVLCAQHAGKYLGCGDAVFVDHRLHEMGRCIAIDLEDELAEIGFDGFAADGFECGYEVGFLGDHGFTFDAELAIVFLGDVDGDLVGLFAIECVVDFHACIGGIFDELFEVVIEVVKCVLFDVASEFPHGVVVFAEGFAADIFTLLIARVGSVVDELLELFIFGGEVCARF